jgi:hypothetical protein
MRWELKLTERSHVVPSILPKKVVVLARTDAFGGCWTCLTMLGDEKGTAVDDGTLLDFDTFCERGLGHSVPEASVSERKSGMVLYFVLGGSRVWV